MLLKRVVKFLALLWLQLCGSLVGGISDVMVELRAPRFVVHGHSAMFVCEHNVDPESIYKVVFFKQGQRIMKFVRERDPPFEIYNFTGADISLPQLSPTSITLEQVDFPAAGAYACEIALETPIYSKISKIHELSVIVRQKNRPRIKIKNRKVAPHEFLEATCHSAPAYPAPHLTWFINNLKVDERLTIPHGAVNVNRHHHGMALMITNSSLQLPLSSLQMFPNQTIEITCLSTIPSYASVGEGFADVQNHSITVNVVRTEPPALTQLPVQIIDDRYSNASNRHYINYLLVLLSCFNFNVF